MSDGLLSDEKHLTFSDWFFVQLIFHAGTVVGGHSIMQGVADFIGALLLYWVAVYAWRFLKWQPLRVSLKHSGAPHER